MTVAYNETTGEIVHGHSLLLIDDNDVLKSSYICPNLDCNYKATPCAYAHDDEHKVRSYFSYRKKHAPQCEVTIQKNINASSTKSQMHSPFTPCIDLLVMPKGESDQTITKKKIHDQLSAIAQVSSSNYTNNNKKSTKCSSYLATVVDFYINNPDKALNSLRIEGFTAKTYQSAFQIVIPPPTTPILYKEGYVLYGEIKFNQQARVHNSTIEIDLIQKSQEEQYTVVLNTSTWKKSHVSAFIMDFDKARAEAKLS